MRQHESGTPGLDIIRKMAINEQTFYHWLNQRSIYMTYYLKLYAITLMAFLAIDLFWLGVIARNLYQKYLGYLMAPEINWWAAFLFYFLFVFGLLVFVVEPGLKTNSLTETIWRAALFGLITYATYDLTNHATVKNWPLMITIVDMIWGMVLSVMVSSISYAAGQWLR